MFQDVECAGRLSVPSKHKTFVQCCASVKDVGPMLYNYYTNVLCLLGEMHLGCTSVPLNDSNRAG